jgi:hypothetical protein
MALAVVTTCLNKKMTNFFIFKRNITHNKRIVIVTCNTVVVADPGIPSTRDANKIIKYNNEINFFVFFIYYIFIIIW